MSPRILLSSFLTIYNPFIIEYYMFFETFAFGLSVLLVTLAWVQIKRYFIAGARLHLRLCMLLLLASSFTYQAALGLFVILCLPTVLELSNGIKAFVKSNLAVALCYGAANAINLGVMKYVLHSSRISIEPIWDYFWLWVKSRLQFLYYTFDIMPRGFFLLLLLSIVLLLCFAITISHDAPAHKICGIFYILLATFVVSFLPTINAEPRPRNIYPIAASFGVLLLYFIKVIPLRKQAARWKQAALLLGVVFAVTEYIGFQNIIVDRYKSNAVDEFEVACIAQEVKDYENEHGITVTKISFYTDEVVTWTRGNPDSHNGDTEPRAFFCTWSRNTILSVLEDLHFTEIENRDDLIQYFSGKKWNAYSPDQLVFIGDELHLCVY